METIIKNWYIILAIIIVIIVAFLFVYSWIKLPSKKKIANIKEWLLYAVIEAEKSLGEKTGQIKLRYVYDLALAKFPWLAFIQFDTFSAWVDDALVKMRELLNDNDAIDTYIHA